MGIGLRGRSTRPTAARRIEGRAAPDLGAPDKAQRVTAAGKHLAIGTDRFSIRGVTYGSFLPRSDGARYPETTRLRNDLESMSVMGFNTVRLYDLPPVDLLQTAQQLGLRLLVGLHYRDWRYEATPGRAANRRIVDRGRREVDALFNRLDESGCDHATVLGVSVGNEVPGDLVRVHGAGAVEHALAQLIDDVHRHDPQLLATYTNYPTTEYLHPGNQDLVTFNVFVEDPLSFRKYLKHLQIVSGDRPLVLTELGLASGVHGLERQADVLGDQLQTVDQVGCAGATIFSWTDEWGVDGEEVPGWGFGITDTDRSLKPAAATAMSWSQSNLKDVGTDWPRVSVVVCAYNEEDTIVECLASLERSDYPDLEVIVCDDGSTDATLELTGRFPFAVLPLPHGGLSRARNAGAEAATGDIVAYLDADAMCHPQWPWYLALAFDDKNVSAVGGPNLAVPNAGLVERAVALAPGSPTEVLTGDDQAEHIVGANMAFRRDVLHDIGGFNPMYTSAGDDVDVCWKLLDRELTIGFSPAAQVFHHRRATISGYLKQQRGYGRAESLLAGAHPGRFNRLGQARWSGFIYGGVGLLPRLLRPVVYHGHQGAAPFQSVSAHRSATALSWATALVPAIVAAGLIGAIGTPFVSALAVIPAVAAIAVALYAVAVAVSIDVDRHEPEPLKLRAIVAAFHIAQPIVRTWGRLTTRRGDSTAETSAVLAARTPAQRDQWTGRRHDWLVDLEARLRRRRLPVVHPGPASACDLIVPLGLFGEVGITVGVAWEWTPHTRVRLRPRWPLAASAALAVLLGATTPGWAGAMLAVTALVAIVTARRLRLVRSVLADSIAPAEVPSNLSQEGLARRS